MAYLTGDKSTTLKRTSFKATAGQSTVSFVDPLNSTFILVYRNGVLLYTDDYTISGNVLTFNIVLELNDEITIIN
jgi:hypothetical protein